MEFDKDVFADNLRMLRAKKRINQEELGQAIGVPGNTIWNYENGKNIPGIDKVCLLADVLGTTPDALVGWE